MTFLPDNYEIPASTGNYMKFKEGLNQFRVLSNAVTGFEYFTSDNKPVRSKTPVSNPSDIKQGGKVKPFWAFAVWNYGEKRVQILEITQKTIMVGIKSLIDNPKWGDVNRYDIAVTKIGEGMETEYNVQGEPPLEDTKPEILKEYSALTVNLEALFTNDDPFTKSDEPVHVEESISSVPPFIG